MIRAVLLSLLFTSSWAEVYPVDITPHDINSTFASIKILDQKEIILKEISGIPFSEASDLAYDSKNQLLYMVGDKGYLYSFKIKITSTIESLLPHKAYKLTKEHGKRFKKKVDSEGLALSPKGELIISFERKPKIALFSTNGQRIKKEKLPSWLANRKNYRSSNKMLESVAYHPKYGILTASELPLKKYKRRQQTIYSLNGKKWKFLAQKNKKSSITAIEVMDDGNLLVLERAFTKFTEPRIITLKKVFLNQVTHGMQKTKVLAKMSSADGWKNDNFEGLARVAPHRYLMISDDNDNFFQRTLLVYFEVIE